MVRARARWMVRARGYLWGPSCWSQTRLQQGVRAAEGRLGLAVCKKPYSQGLGSFASSGTGLQFGVSVRVSTIFEG